MVGWLIDRAGWLADLIDRVEGGKEGDEGKKEVEDKKLLE